MFNKKNDPLVESVKAVMKQNEVHRQAEAALNEELGISSKKALPHEYHAQYDALLEAKVFHADAVEAGKLASKFRDTVDKLLTGKSKKTPDDDPYKQQLKRRKGRRKGTLDEKINMSKADIAELRPPKKKFTGADLAALRAGEHKMEEESGLKSTMNGTDTPAKGAKPAGKLEEKATEAQKEKIHKVMSEFKRRKLHSGSKKGPTVTSREQAVAIALNQAGLSKKKMNEAKIPSHEELIDAHKSYFNKNEMERTPAEIADAAKYMHKALSNPDHPDHSNAKKALRQIMAESVIDEIRENLEANLIAIHESGDDELFENYVNSLTEEELQILGLNETSGGGLFGMGGFPSKSDPKQDAPKEEPGAQTRPTQPEVSKNTITNIPGSRPDSTTGRITGQPQSLDPRSQSAVGAAPAITSAAQQRPSLPTPPANSRTDAPVAGIGKTPKADAPAEEPGAQTRPAQAPAPKPATPAARPTTPAARPAARPAPRPAPRPSAEPNIHMQAFGATAVSGDSARGPQVYRENVQIKESLESFLRNRFLKG
jgi:hypothetical protein